MKPIALKPSRLTAASALAAAFAAIALTACEPNDSTETAQVAATSAAQPQPATVGAEVPPAVVERQGAPVPAPAPAPTPAYAPPPIQVAAAPPAPAPQAAYPAQSNPPVRPQPAGYAPSPDDAVPAPAPVPRAVDRNHVGSIASIEPIRERPQGTGTGAVIGGVLGGVLGNQFGHGSGRAVMTGAGVVGGAVIGNNVERNRRTAVTGYRIAIRLDNGTTRTFQRSQVGSLQVGDRVELDAKSFHRV